jgi:hypothetical protein
MQYEVPKVTDLGQISKHVFVNGFSLDGDLNGEPTAFTGNQGFVGDGATSGSSGGLAGLGLIGGVFAALAGRSSNEQQQIHAGRTPEDEQERVNER